MTHETELLPVSVSQKEIFKQSVKEDIMEGRLNPLEFYRRAKLIGDCIEELKKDSDVFDCAVSERAKYGKQKPVISGSVVDTGSKTTYDYTTCNDAVWTSLKQSISEREKFLKSLPAGGLLVTDPEGGETVRIYPPVAKVSEYITVKI